MKRILIFIGLKVAELLALVGGIAAFVLVTYYFGVLNCIIFFSQHTEEFAETFAFGAIALCIVAFVYSFCFLMYSIIPAIIKGNWRKAGELEKKWSKK